MCNSFVKHRIWGVEATDMESTHPLTYIINWPLNTIFYDVLGI
jgi:hypothetical protein